MARKKRLPSFEIPETVRRASQAGWVYRSGKAAPRGRHAGPRRASTRVATREAEAPAETARPRPPAPAPVAPSVTGGLVALGLQVAAVPFVVPLFLTAAISRHLGLTDPQ